MSSKSLLFFAPLILALAFANAASTTESPLLAFFTIPGGLLSGITGFLESIYDSGSIITELVFEAVADIGRSVTGVLGNGTVTIGYRVVTAIGIIIKGTGELIENVGEDIQKGQSELATCLVTKHFNLIGASLSSFSKCFNESANHLEIQVNEFAAAIKQIPVTQKAFIKNLLQIEAFKDIFRLQTWRRVLKLSLKEAKDEIINVFNVVKEFLKTVLHLLGSILHLLLCSINGIGTDTASAIAGVADVLKCII